MNEIELKDTFESFYDIDNKVKLSFNKNGYLCYTTLKGIIKETGLTKAGYELLFKEALGHLMS